MKTLKFALIAVVIACTMVNLASANEFNSKPKINKVVNLSFEKAMSNHGLVLAMYGQLVKEDFLNSHQHVYTALVSYQGIIYRITGSFDQWMKFFRRRADLPANASKGVINN